MDDTFSNNRCKGPGWLVEEWSRAVALSGLEQMVIVEEASMYYLTACVIVLSVIVKCDIDFGVVCVLLLALAMILVTLR